MIVKVTGRIIPEELNVYVVTVETMIGDADGYESFEQTFEEVNELKDYIIKLEVISKQYPHGRGGNDHYNFLDFFEEDFEDWPYDIDSDCLHTFDSYEVTYIDELGHINGVNIELDEKDNELIDSYGVRT